MVFFQRFSERGNPKVDEHLPREVLSVLPTTMKVPPWIIMLGEPLNIDAQKSDLGGKNRA